MSGFLIAEISAIPELPTRNSNGTVLVNNPSVVWTPVNLNVDPLQPDGSLASVTFQIPLSGGTYEPKVTCRGTCAFPSNYAGSQYRVVASLSQNGKPVDIFRSKNITPAVVLNPPAPVPILESSFELVSGLKLPDSSIIPFRIAGDFEWRLEFTVPTFPAISFLKPTRLEFNWARVKAPNGPLAVPDPTNITKVNLGSVYPIGLCRLFFFSPAELAAIVDYKNTWASVYARNVVQRIWAWGNPSSGNHPSYDALRGAPSFNVSSGGGSFDLDKWMANNTSTTCNCYDLAAIVQLGCCLLMNDGGYEHLDSRWVYQDPNGYIKSCELYGWSTTYPYVPGDDSKPGVNNPFFLKEKPPNPYVDPPSLTNRWYFDNHAWVEVTIPPVPVTRWVLDATTAVAVSATDIVPETGRSTRPAYASAHIDKAADPKGWFTGNLNDNLIANPSSTGDCYINNTWYYKQALPNYVGRLGVLDISGVGPVMKAPLMAPSIAHREAEIERLLAKGRSSSSTPTGFNNSDISAEALVPILIDNEPSISLHSHRTRVTEDVTLLEIILNAGVDDTASGPHFDIRLEIFNEASYATASLIFVLAGYQAPNLPEMFDGPTTPLGDICLISRQGQSIHIVVGNQYLRLSLVMGVPGCPQLDASFPVTAESIARRLVHRLTSVTVPAGEHRRPSLPLSDPTPMTVHRGEVFTLEAQENEFAAITADSSNTSAVIFAGPGEGANHLKFLAMSEGNTELKVYVAHKATLAPGMQTVQVTVEP